MFSVGLPIVSALSRGTRNDRVVETIRNQVRQKIDKAKETPRNVVVGKLVSELHPLGKAVSKLSNRGYDPRHLVKEARSKLQHNKANSPFLDTPYKNTYLSEKSRVSRVF